MAPSAALLELQAIDLEVDRLTARAAALEAGEGEAEVRREADAVEVRLGEHRLRLLALDRDSARLEHEIDSLRQRSSAEERRLYDGSIANAKELGSLQHEIDNLGRRISDREDELLALMEEREAVDANASLVEGDLAQLRARVDEVVATSADESRTVRVELEEQLAARTAAVTAIEPDVIELYEELRRTKKGIGAAAIVDGVCQGCHEQLSSVELDRLKRSDGVKRCEHCRRIVVFA